MSDFFFVLGWICFGIWCFGFLRLVFYMGKGGEEGEQHAKEVGKAFSITLRATILMFLMSYFIRWFEGTIAPFL